MKHWILFGTVCFLVLSIFITPVGAESGTISVEPAKIELNLKVGIDTPKVYLRLSSAQVESGLIKIWPADFLCQDEAGQPMFPLPSGGMAVTPSSIEKIKKGMVEQVVLSPGAAEKAGMCSGQLTINWQTPEPGELVVPVVIHFIKDPQLVVQSPEKLAMQGVSGEKGLTRSFPIFEKSDAAQVTGIKTSASNFYAQDNLKMIPAEKVLVSAPGQLGAGESGMVTVQVDLKDVSPGVYNGNLVLQAERGIYAVIPVNLSVRDGATLPWLLLLLGVAVGVWLSFYKDKGRQQDELRVRLNKITQRINPDKELQDNFGHPLREGVNIALDALNDDIFEVCTKKADELNTCLNNWENSREDWLLIIKYIKFILQPRLEGEGWILKQLRSKLAESTQKALIGGIKIYQAEIEKIEAILTRWNSFNERIKKIEELRADVPLSIPEETRNGWREGQESLTTRCSALNISEPATWDDLDKDIQHLFEEIRDRISEQASDQKNMYSIRGYWDQKVLAAMSDKGSPPPVMKDTFYVPLSGAVERLTFFWFIVYVLGGISLALAGYSNLYLAQPAFGSEPIRDYLSLLLWGLGGQAGMTTVLDLLRGFGFRIWK
jgi:hypothetical protein